MSPPSISRITRLVQRRMCVFGGLFVLMNLIHGCTAQWPNPPTITYGPSPVPTILPTPAPSASNAKFLPPESTLTSGRTCLDIDLLPPAVAGDIGRSATPVVVPGPWSAWYVSPEQASYHAPAHTLETFSNCTFEGERPISRFLRHRNASMDPGIVPGILYDFAANGANLTQQFVPLLPSRAFVPSTMEASQRARRMIGSPDVSLPDAPLELRYRTALTEQTQEVHGALAPAVHEFRTLTGRYVCFDRRDLVSSPMPSARCRWAVKEPRPGQLFQEMTCVAPECDTFVAYVRALHYPRNSPVGSTIEHGSSVVFVGADMRPRIMEETNARVLPVASLSQADEGSVRIIAERNSTTWQPSVGIRVSDPVPAWTLRVAPDAIHTHPDRHLPAWSVEDLTCPMPVHAPPDTVPLLDGDCFVRIRHFVPTNRDFFYALTRPDSTLTLDFEPVASSSVLGIQVVLDLTTSGKLRVEYDPATRTAIFWANLNLTQDVCLSGTPVWGLYHEGVLLSPDTLLVEHYFATSSSTFYEVPMGCGGPPTAVLCAPDADTVRCIEQRGNDAQVLASGGVIQIVQRRPFDGRIGRVAWWARTLVPYEIDLWTRHVALDAWWKLHYTGMHRTQDTDASWFIDCRADVAVTNETIQLSNRFGGVRCVGTPVHDQKRSVAFLPVIQCHDCPVDRPYKCTDYSCVATPDGCELIPNTFSVQRSGHAPWQRNDTFVEFHEVRNDTAASVVMLRCGYDPGTIECASVAGVCTRWYTPPSSSALELGDVASFSCPDIGIETTFPEHPCVELRCWPDTAPGIKIPLNETKYDHTVCVPKCKEATSDVRAYNWIPPVVPDAPSYCICMGVYFPMPEGESGPSTLWSLDGWPVVQVDGVLKPAVHDLYVGRSSDGHPLHAVLAGRQRETESWHSHLPCPGFLEILMSGVAPTLAYTRLQDEVSQIMDRVARDQIRFVMKAPETWVPENEAVALPLFDASDPNPRASYEIPMNKEWTISFAIRTQQQRSTTGEVLPMSLATEEAFRYDQLHTLNFDHMCHRTRVFDAVSGSWMFPDTRTCNDGTSVPSTDATWCINHGGTRTCPSSTPVMCARSQTIAAVPEAPSASVEFVNQVADGTNGGSVSYATRLVPITPNEIGLVGVDGAILYDRVLRNTRITVVRLDLKSYAAVMRQAVFAAPSTQYCDALVSNDPDYCRLVDTDVFLQRTDGLYFARWDDAMDFDEQVNWSESYAPWVRVEPKSVDLTGYAGVQAFERVRSNSTSTPMTIYRCSSPSRPLSWIAGFYSIDRLPSTIGCEGFAIRLPIDMGMGVVSPFFAALDTPCVGAPEDCVEPFVAACTSSEDPELCGVKRCETAQTQPQTQPVATEPECLRVEERGTPRLPMYALKEWTRSDGILNLGSRPELTLTESASYVVTIRISAHYAPANAGLYTPIVAKTHCGTGSILLTSDTHHLVFLHGEEAEVVCGNNFDSSENHTLPVFLEHDVDHHLALVRDWGARRVLWYVNSTLVYTEEALLPTLYPYWISTFVGGSLTVFSGTLFPGTMAHLHIYDFALTSEHVRELWEGRSLVPMEITATYVMPWGPWGDQRLLRVWNDTRDDCDCGGVQCRCLLWNNCGPRPDQWVTNCTAGGLLNNQIWTQSARSLVPYISRVDLEGDLIFPTQQGEIVADRVEPLWMAPCDFAKVEHILECDTACTACSGACESVDSVFKIRAFASIVHGRNESLCLTVSENETRGPYMSRCIDMSQGTGQLFRFKRLDPSAGRAMLATHQDPHRRSIEQCLVVRDFLGVRVLAVDHDCSMWSSVRFLREGVVVDSDLAMLYTRAVVDTIPPPTNQEGTLWPAVVTVSFKDTGATTYTNIPTGQFEPKITTGNPILSSTDFRTYESSYRTWGTVGMAFGAHQVGISNEVADVPASGALVGRNWLVVRRGFAPVGTLPAADWMQLHGDGQDFMVRISRGEVAAVFNVTSVEECKRTCELGDTCQAVSVRRAVGTTGVECTHGTKAAWNRVFNATVSFRATRAKSFREVLAESAAGWTQSYYTGPVDLYTGKAATLLQTLRVSLASPRSFGRDDAGRAVSVGCLTADWHSWLGSNQEATRLRVDMDSIYYPTDADRGRLVVTPLFGADYAHCASDLASTPVVVRQPYVVLPLECVHQLELNRTYEVSASRAGESHRLLYMRYEICGAPQAPSMTTSKTVNGYSITDFTTLFVEAGVRIEVVLADDDGSDYIVWFAPTGVEFERLRSSEIVSAYTSSVFTMQRAGGTLFVDLDTVRLAALRGVIASDDVRLVLLRVADPRDRRKEVLGDARIVYTGQDCFEVRKECPAPWQCHTWSANEILTITNGTEQAVCEADPDRRYTLNTTLYDGCGTCHCCAPSYVPSECTQPTWNRSIPALVNDEMFDLEVVFVPSDRGSGINSINPFCDTMMSMGGVLDVDVCEHTLYLLASSTSTHPPEQGYRAVREGSNGLVDNCTVTNAIVATSAHACVELCDSIACSLYVFDGTECRTYDCPDRVVGLMAGAHANSTTPWAVNVTGFYPSYGSLVGTAGDLSPLPTTYEHTNMELMRITPNQYCDPNCTVTMRSRVQPYASEMSNRLDIWLTSTLGKIQVRSILRWEPGTGYIRGQRAPMPTNTTVELHHRTQSLRVCGTRDAPVPVPPPPSPFPATLDVLDPKGVPVSVTPQVLQTHVGLRYGTNLSTVHVLGEEQIGIRIPGNGGASSRRIMRLSSTDPVVGANSRRLLQHTNSAAWEAALVIFIHSYITPNSLITASAEFDILAPLFTGIYNAPELASYKAKSYYPAQSSYYLCPVSSQYAPDHIEIPPWAGGSGETLMSDASSPDGYYNMIKIGSLSPEGRYYCDGRHSYCRYDVLVSCRGMFRKYDIHLCLWGCTWSQEQWYAWQSPRLDLGVTSVAPYGRWGIERNSDAAVRYFGSIENLNACRVLRNQEYLTTATAASLYSPLYRSYHNSNGNCATICAATIDSYGSVVIPLLNRDNSNTASTDPVQNQIFEARGTGADEGQVKFWKCSSATTLHCKAHGDFSMVFHYHTNKFNPTYSDLGCIEVTRSGVPTGTPTNAPTPPTNPPTGTPTTKAPTAFCPAVTVTDPQGIHAPLVCASAAHDSDCSVPSAWVCSGDAPKCQASVWVPRPSTCRPAYDVCAFRSHWKGHRVFGQHGCTGDVSAWPLTSPRPQVPPSVSGSIATWPEPVIGELDPHCSALVPVYCPKENNVCSAAEWQPLVVVKGTVQRLVVAKEHWITNLHIKDDPFDDNHATYAVGTAQASPFWIVVDLGKRRAVHSVVVHFVGAGGSGCDLATSGLGASKLVIVGTAYALSPGSCQVSANFASPVVGQRLALVQDAAATYQMFVSEFEIFYYPDYDSTLGIGEMSATSLASASDTVMSSADCQRIANSPMGMARALHILGLSTPLYVAYDFVHESDGNACYVSPFSCTGATCIRFSWSKSGSALYTSARTTDSPQVRYMEGSGRAGEIQPFACSPRKCSSQLGLFGTVETLKGSWYNRHSEWMDAYDTVNPNVYCYPTSCQLPWFKRQVFGGIDYVWEELSYSTSDALASTCGRSAGDDCTGQNSDFVCEEVQCQPASSSIDGVSYSLNRWTYSLGTYAQCYYKVCGKVQIHYRGSLQRDDVCPGIVPGQRCLVDPFDVGGVLVYVPVLYCKPGDMSAARPSNQWSVRHARWEYVNSAGDFLPATTAIGAYDVPIAIVQASMTPPNTPAPTQAPTLGYALSTEGIDEWGGQSPGFTCSSHPHVAFASFATSCDDTRFCHPTALALDTTSPFLPWTACPRDGCSAVDGYGQRACMYRQSGATSGTVDAFRCECRLVPNTTDTTTKLFSLAFREAPLHSDGILTSSMRCAGASVRSEHCTASVKTWLGETYDYVGPVEERVSSGGSSPVSFEGCSVSRDFLKTRDSNECVDFDTIPRFRRPDDVANEFVVSGPDQCALACANPASGCVTWIYSTVDTTSQEFDVVDYLTLDRTKTYTYKTTVSLRANTCVLLVRSANPIAASSPVPLRSIWYGSRICPVRVCETMLGPPISEPMIDACKSSCKSNLDCTGFEWTEWTLDATPITTPCQLLRCGTTDTAMTEKINQLRPGIAMWTKGYVAETETRNTSHLEFVEKQPLCEGTRGPYYPSRAQDLDEAQFRFSERCPSGYTEIASGDRCAAARPYVDAAGLVWASDVQYACDTKLVGVTGLSVAVSQTPKSVCARRCFDDWRCNFFDWTGSGRDRTIERLYVDPSELTTGIVVLPRAITETDAVEECAYWCERSSTCSYYRYVSRISASNEDPRCLLFDSVSVATTGLVGYRVNRTFPVWGECRTFASCPLVDNVTSYSGYSITRPTGPVDQVPANMWQRLPAGCVTWWHDGRWEIAFNTLRNYVSWSSQSEHELPGHGLRSTQGLVGFADWAYQRVCSALPGKEWMGYFETTGSEAWGSLDYGTEGDVSVPRYTTWTNASMDGVEYKLASDHGVPCPAGFVNIETPVQCSHAARALGLPRRVEATTTNEAKFTLNESAQTTWYLVRRTVDGWHAAQDDLRGSDVYGEYEVDSFSVEFEQAAHTHILLTSGDKNAWMIIPRDSDCLANRSLSFNGTECVSTQGASPDEDTCRHSWYPWITKSSKSYLPHKSLYAGRCRLQGWTGQQDPAVEDPIVAMTHVDGTPTRPDEVLYCESGCPTGIHPPPSSGAEVWINAVPSDGFVMSRRKQMPGCSLDTPLVPDLRTARDTGTLWSESTSEFAVRQHGDNTANFNILQAHGPSWLAANETHTSLESTLVAQGNAWARGRQICVDASHLIPSMIRMPSLSDPPHYLMVSEPGWRCPSMYVPILNASQCAEAVQYGLAWPIAGSSMWIERVRYIAPLEFVRRVRDLSDEDYYLPGCSILSESALQQMSFWSEPVAGVNMWRDVAPDFFRSVHDERVLVDGHAVCVLQGHFRESDPAVVATIRQALAVEKYQLSSVVQTEGKLYEGRATVEIELGGLSISDGIDTMSLEELVRVVVTTHLCPRSSVTVTVSTASRRLLSTTTSTIVIVSLESQRVVVYDELAALRDAFGHDAPGNFLALLQSLQLVHGTVPGVLGLTSDQVRISSEKVDLIPGKWSVETLMNLTSSRSGVLEHKTWWEARCECDAASRVCEPGVDNFFRVNSSNGGEVLVPDVDSLDGCMEACRASHTCRVMTYNEDASDFPCRAHSNFAVLDDLTESARGGTVVSVQFNRCPVVYLEDVDICPSDSGPGSACVQLTNSIDTERPYVRTARSSGSVLDGLGASIMLAPGDDGDARVRQCWSHTDSSRPDDVLCEDGEFLPMYNVSEAWFVTDDCTSTGTSRRYCPPNAPYMCSIRHEASTDMLCTADPERCTVLGGLRSCAWVAYDSIGVPAFENVPLDPDRPIETWGYESTHRNEVLIDSVGRCGVEFGTPSEARARLSPTNCSTGFECCAGDTCTCPQAGRAEDLAIYDGELAGACYPRIHRWPQCVHECVSMGAECQYYMRRGDDCVLCYTSTLLVNDSNWTYHVVRTPAVPPLPIPGTRYAHSPGGSGDADATLRIQGDWYAMDDVCPVGYTSVDSDHYSDHVMLTHCEQAAKAFDGASTIEQVVCNSTVAPVRRCVQCEHGVCVSDCAANSNSPRVCHYRSVLSSQNTWMRCSRECSSRQSCSNWAWNKKSRKCAIMSTHAGGEIWNLYMSNVSGYVAAPFGDDWIGGLRAIDPVDRGEHALLLEHVRVYGSLSEAETRRIHFEMAQKIQMSHDVSATTSFVLPPSSNEYIGDTGDNLGSVYDAPADYAVAMTSSLVQTSVPREALVLDDRCPDYEAQDAPDWMRDAPVYTKSARLQAPLGTLPLLGPWTLVTWVRVERPGCLWVFRNESVCIDSAVRIARGNITYESLAILGTRRWYHVAIRMLPRPRLFVDATPVPLYVTPTSPRVRVGDMSVWNLVVLDDTANFEIQVRDAQLHLNNPQRDFHAALVINTSEVNITASPSFAWTQGDCLPQSMTVNETYDFQAVFDVNLLSSSAFYDEVKAGTMTPRWLGHRDGRAELVSSSKGWTVSQIVDDEVEVVSDGMRMYLQAVPDDTTTFPEVYSLHAKSDSPSLLQDGVELLLTDLAGDVVTVRCYGICSGEVGAFFTMISTIGGTTGALMDRLSSDGAPSVVSSFFANGTEAHAVEMGDLCTNDTYRVRSAMTGRCMVGRVDGMGYASCDQLPRDTSCWSIRVVPPPVLDLRWRSIRFDDSGLRPHTSIVGGLRTEERLFLQPNTSTDLHFTVLVPSDPLDAEPGVRMQTVQGFDRAARRLAVQMCTGEWTSGEIRRCDTPCNVVSNVSVCYARGVPTPGTCMDSCFPRLLNRSEVEAGLDVFFVGLEFQIRALTIGHQLRVLRRNSVAAENDMECLSSNVDPRDEDAVQLTRCDSLYQDFFQLLPVDAQDARVLGDNTAKVLQSRTSGKCMGIFGGRVRMLECGISPLFFRMDLRIDESDAILPSAVEIGASPLISYGTSVASMSVRLHRRVLGGTTSVRISTTNGNLTLVDDVGGLSHSESGWVYLCRVIRTNDGERYTLVRNGTVVDTQTRFEPPSKSAEETPRRLLLDRESTAQVVLPSLKVVPLVGGDPRATDDADRRYASGTYHMPNSSYLECGASCVASSTCKAARWSEMTRECEQLLRCERDTQHVAAGYPNTFNLRPGDWYVFTPKETGPIHPDAIGGITTQSADRSDSSVISTPGATFDSVLDSAYDDLIVGRRLLAHWEDWFREAGTMDYTREVSVSTRDVSGETVANSILQEFATRAGFPRIVKRSVDETVTFQCTGTRIFVLSGVFRTPDSAHGYRQILESASESGEGGLRLRLSPDAKVLDRRGGVRVAVSSDIGCVSVLIIQCTRAGFVMTVDGQLVHRAEECPYQMDATDTVVHSWGGRRDAFCMEGNDFLEQPQHADLVGFLQREALDRNDTLCWKGSTADGKKAASRFFALPVDSVDEDLGAAGEWGVAVKEETGRLLSTCADDMLCPGSDLYSLYFVRAREDLRLLMRMDTDVYYAKFLNRTGEPDTHHRHAWRDTLRWIPWNPDVLSCSDCAQYNVSTSISELDQTSACNFGGKYNDAIECLEVDPNFVPNQMQSDTALPCIEATACNCRADGFVDGTSVEYFNSCSKVCEVVVEEGSHPQQPIDSTFRRNTGRAEDVDMNGIQDTQERWGAKRLLRVERTRDARTVGCLGYFEVGCSGEPCHYRVEEAKCTQDCPLQPRFELRKDTIQSARSRSGTPACSSSCGHSIRTCRFTRHVVNWDEMVEYYGNVDVVKTVVEQTHIDDMREIARISPYQSFDDNACARRVYTTETVNSIVSADVMKVEFDVHQREVYGEWGFQWIQPHLLAAFNLSGVECEYPCPAEMCEEGPVSPPPRLHELAYEYDGELLFVLMAKGLVPYVVAWTSLCVVIGLVLRN